MRRFQMLVIRRVDRINPAEHHRMNFLEARQHRRRIARVGDRVAHLHFRRALDVRREITRLADFQFLARVRFRIEAADFLHLDIFAGVQQFHLLAGLQFAVENADVRDDAFVSVEIRIETPAPASSARPVGFGGGMRATIASRMSSMPMPSLALHGIASSRRNRQHVLQLLFRLRHIRVAAGQSC